MMRAWARGLTPRLLLFIWLAELVPALAAMLPILSLLGPKLAHLPGGKETFTGDAHWVDLLALIAPGRQALSGVFVLSFLLSLLLVPAVSAAIVASLRGERLWAAVARDYGRQLRLSCIGALPLLLAAGLAVPAVTAATHFADRALTEHAAHLAMNAALAWAAVLVIVAWAWMDCARAAMVHAVEPTGAWRSFKLGTRIFWRHFFSKTWAEAGPLLVALVLTALILWLRGKTHALILLQAVPVILAWSRTARVAAISEP